MSYPLGRNPVLPLRFETARRANDVESARAVVRWPRATCKECVSSVRGVRRRVDYFCHALSVKRRFEETRPDRRQATLLNADFEQKDAPKLPWLGGDDLEMGLAATRFTRRLF